MSFCNNLIKSLLFKIFIIYLSILIITNKYHTTMENSKPDYKKWFFFFDEDYYGCSYVDVQNTIFIMSIF